MRGTVSAAGLGPRADRVASVEASDLPLPPPGPPVSVDQKDFAFVPAVLAVLKGTTVRFSNDDPEPHNVYSPEGGYDLGTWRRGEVRSHVFARPGVYTQRCAAHPGMRATIVVLETPYFATTDADGRFQIEGIPPGRYSLVIRDRRGVVSSRPIVIGSGETVEASVVLEH